MAQDEDLLQKADALMRRHRVFVAGAVVPHETAADTEDVPVLTEIVDPGAAASAVPAAIEDAMAAQHAAMAAELERWLDTELPQHVMRVLDGVTDQLIAQLSLKAKAELLPKLLNILSAPELPTEPDSANN